MPTPRQAKLSGKEKRTSTVAAKEYTARGDPWWNNGAGEQLKWRVKRLELPARLEVTAAVRTILIATTPARLYCRRASRPASCTTCYVTRTRSAHAEMRVNGAAR